MKINLPKKEWPEAFREAKKLATSIILLCKKTKKYYSMTDALNATKNEANLSIVVLAHEENRVQIEADYVHMNLLMAQVMDFMIDCPDGKTKKSLVKKLRAQLAKNPGMNFLLAYKQAMETIYAYSLESFHKDNERPWELAQKVIKNATH